jgi:hypothetical protein
LYVKDECPAARFDVPAICITPVARANRPVPPLIVVTLVKWTVAGGVKVPASAMVACS